MEQAQSIIQAVCQTVKEPWTLVLYNLLANIEPKELEKACQYFNAKHSRIVSVCSIIKSDGKCIAINKFLAITIHYSCINRSCTACH